MIAYVKIYFGYIYSTASRSPITWLVDGPRTLYHNFSTSFCEIKLNMTIYNSSDSAASVRLNTFDNNSSSNLGDLISAPAASSGNQVGWHDVSPATDIKVTSDVAGGAKFDSLENVPPFIWSGSSSNRAQLEPMSTADVPLQICVFSPGTFNLSNYVLHWNLLPSNSEGNSKKETRESSGTCQGYQYYLTVLQSV